jgi:hypothetical protein
VASYLILATLAGPSMCCCTVGRLAAQIAATIRSGASDNDGGCCCCKHAAAKRQSPSNDSNHEERAPGDGPSCPCDRDHARVGAVDDDALSAIRIVSVSFEPADVSHTGAIAGIVLATRTSDIDNDVFLNVNDLLRAMHFLRC